MKIPKIGILPVVSFQPDTGDISFNKTNRHNKWIKMLLKGKNNYKIKVTTQRTLVKICGIKARCFYSNLDSKQMAFQPDDRALNQLMSLKKLTYHKLSKLWRKRLISHPVWANFNNFFRIIFNFLFLFFF